MITRLEDVRESALTWPESKPRAARRERGPFRAEVAKATREIEGEMTRWGVRQFIISRNNQRIFAGDPGAALWWLDKKKQLRVLACDKYETIAANLHAIYLTLDAMRALGRWGAYTVEQAAEGARPALPPPEGSSSIDWRTVLGALPPGISTADAILVVNGRYRRMAADAAGDDNDLRRLNLAIEAARKELGG